MDRARSEKAGSSLKAGNRTASGFTLLEVALSLFLLGILALSLAPSVTLFYSLHQRLSAQWKAAVEAWNRASAFQAWESAEHGSTVVPGSWRRLEVLRIEQPSESGLIVWEVYRAK